MANNLQWWALFLVGAFATSTASAFDNFKDFRRDSWDLELNTRYFYSDANHTGSGTQSLPAGGHFSLLDINLETRYVPKHNWSVLAFGTIANSESNNSVVSRTNSTISQVGGGVDYLMFSGLIDLVAEGVGWMGFEKADPLSDVVMNNEGVMQFQSRLIAQKKWRDGWRAYGWGGFTFRSEGRSFLLPWGFGAHKKSRKHTFGGELFGYESITNDEEGNTAVRTSYINSVNAGSYLFYKPNPSLIEARAYGQWSLNRKWSVLASGGMTLAGNNMASGFHIAGGVRYTFDLTEGYTEDLYNPVNNEVPAYKSRMHGGTANKPPPQKDYFYEETSDGVDQKIFEQQRKPTAKPRVGKPQKQDFNIKLKKKPKAKPKKKR